jgi:hypothetical protein
VFKELDGPWIVFGSKLNNSCEGVDQSSA